MMRTATNYSNHLIIEEIKAYHRFQANRRNPVFLYGPSRSGKTTILKAIEDYLSRRRGIRVLRLDTEDIVAELIKSIRHSGDTEGFYSKFRSYNALLIDNIWVLRGRPKTAEEIFNLLKALADMGNLVVIAWDIAPETLLRGTRTTEELRESSTTFKTKPYNPSQ